MTRTSFVVAALLAAAVAAGCGGSSKTHPAVGGSGASSKVWHPGVPDSLGPVVAVVGSRKIRAHEVDSLIATAPPQMQAQLHEPEGYKNVVERIVQEEAIYLGAVRAGMENDPAYRAAAAKSARETMMRMYYQRRAAGFPTASDSAIQAYYQAHQSDFEIPARVRVRHIQVATKSKAASLRKKLQGGALWDALARHNSTDKVTASNGGILGFITPQTSYVPGVGNAPNIVKVAFELKENETSQPVESDKGWHLIRVDQSEPAKVQPLEQVRMNIEGTLGQDIQQASTKAFIDSLKTAAGATMFEDSIAAAVRPAESCQDMFKKAQTAATPNDRIDGYRRVVNLCPDDSIAVQAAFMVGFTYAEELEQYDHARAEFKAFLAKYPNSELAKSATWMMENMDKPAPELKDAPEGTGSTGAPPDSTR